MAPPDTQVWSEETGIEGLDDQLNPLKRWGWPRRVPMDGDVPAESARQLTGDRPGNKPVNRIHDDMKTQGNSSSGGPGGLYSDMRAHQAGLREELAQAETPMAKPSMKNRLLTALADVGPTLAAAKFGGRGGAVGADTRMQAGVQRRQSEFDLEKQRKFQRASQLRSEIEQTERGTLQAEMQERGLDERARLQREAEDARAENLKQTIAQRDRAIGERGDEAQQLEALKQRGRMELNAAKMRGAEAVARIHAATATGRIPPVVSKAVDSFTDSQSRLDIMQKNYEAGLRGDQQAMVSLLANHIGMTLGIAHVRPSQQLIQEAERTAPLSERISASFDDRGYLMGVTLSPAQMRQMVELAEGRLVEDSRKLQDMESYFGVKGKTDMKPKIPSQTPPDTAAGGGAGGGAAGAGATGAAKPAHKVGEKVTYKNKEYTIKAIRPDGSYELGN